MFYHTAVLIISNEVVLKWSVFILMSHPCPKVIYFVDFKSNQIQFSVRVVVFLGFTVNMRLNSLLHYQQ